MGRLVGFGFQEKRILRSYYFQHNGSFVALNASCDQWEVSGTFSLDFSICQLLLLWCRKVVSSDSFGWTRKRAEQFELRSPLMQLIRLKLGEKRLHFEEVAI